MVRLFRVIAVGALVALSGACASNKPSHVSPSNTTSTASAPATSAAVAPCATATSAPGGQSGQEVNPPGDIPDNQAFVSFSPPAGKYSVKVPEGWARTDAQDAVSFTDKFNTIRIDVVSAAQAPSVDSATADDVPRLAATVRCFGDAKVATATRKAGTAVLITYRADAPADPVTGKVVRDDVERYEFWRAGTEAVITLSGALGSDNVDPWRLVTDSFAWL